MKLKYPVLALAKCKQIFFYFCRLFCIKMCQNILQSPLSGILFLQERKGMFLRCFMFLRKLQCPPWKSQSPRDALWTGGCGDCRPPGPLWGMKTRPEECVSFDEADLWLVRLHARLGLLHLPKAYFGVFLHPHWSPLTASGSWCSPKHLPPGHGGGRAWEWRSPLENNLPPCTLGCTGMHHAEGPSWAVGQALEACGKHGGCMALCAQGQWCQHKHPHSSTSSVTGWTMQAQQVAEPGCGL